MASSPGADFQLCPLCQERYGPTRRRQALPCLHAVCCQCLSAAGFPAPELRCPICGQKATLSEPWGMDALPTSSFLLRNLQDALGTAAEEPNHSGRGLALPPRKQRHRWSNSGSSPAAASAAGPDPLLLRWPPAQGEPPCSSWNERNAASFRGRSSGYRLLWLRYLFSSVGGLVCHGGKKWCVLFQVLHFYCDTCSVPICSECIMGPHMGHNFVYLQDALQDSRTLTIQLLGDAQQGRQDIQMSIEQIQAMAEQVEMKTKVLQSEIRAMTYRHKKALENWECELLWKVEKINQVQAKSVHLQVEKLRQNLNNLDNTVSAVQQVLEEGCSTDILLARDCMRAQVQELKNVRGLLQLQEDVRIMFTPPDQALYTAIKSMGFFSSGAFAPLTRATGEGLKCALQGRVASFTVRCYDHDGNPCLSGGDMVSAVVMGPDGNLFGTDVHDQQNGTYLVSYRPQLEGEHLVSVMMCNHHIENSPFKVMVKAGLCYIGVGLPGLSFVSEENRGGASLPPPQQDCPVWPMYVTEGY
nr:E3 ubiquitin-protein ligase TRIM71-like [Chelonoidis abingdonii]